MRSTVVYRPRVPSNELPDLSALRREYQTRGLDPRDVDPSPFVQFNAWFGEVAASAVLEPNAVVLATADVDGRPSARHVLVKGIDDRGFVLYTNYESRKSAQLEANPYASIVFTWSELARQVCVDGPVERVDASESDAYFAARPRGSRIGAWASPQSSVIPGRQVLDDNVAAAEARFDGEVPRPENWGGWRIVPTRIEFWQGRPSRLHDRVRYERAADDGWTIDRLAP